MTPLLSVENLTVEFRSGGRATRVVDRVSLDVMPGETVAVVGESGSGKSVTALSVMRLVEREGGVIAQGRVRLDLGERVVDLTTSPEAELRRIRGAAMSMIFQEPMTSLNPVFSIGDQLAEVPRLHQGRSKQDALAEARRMLDRVRIPEAKTRLTQYPHELSGGMRQRVMIAMALMCRPRLLIADEPTTALDVTIQAQILSLIDELRRELGMAVLFITHDLGVVAEVAERVVVMRRGEVVERGAVADLLSAPVHPYARALVAAVPRLGSGAGPPAAQAHRPVLAVQGLTKRFELRRGLLKRLVGHVHAVEDVSFEVGEGESLALVGESGCGKSTTGRSLTRLVEPTSGTIAIGGRDVTTLDRRAMRAVRRDIQMIFQDPYASLNPRLPALDIVTEPLVIHEPDMGASERRDRASLLLRRVGLEDQHLARYPHQFSGGQRQRLAIARALSLGPKIIVADEPVSALDVSVQAQVIDLMRELQAELGIAYLFISHDMAVVERMSHRIAVMHLGEIVEIGPSAAVLGAPRHPYTRRLLDAVPTLDPSRRRRRALDATDIASPFRPLGYEPPVRPMTAFGNEHYARL